MRYILKNIKSFMQHEKLIFFIMLLCVFSSSMILNFSYGLYQNYHSLKTEAEFELSQITPEINEDSVLTKGEFQQYIESIRADVLNQTTVIHATADLASFPSEDYGSFYMRFNYYDGVYQISEVTSEAYEKNGMMMSGRYITNEEEAAGSYVAIVANDGSGWNDATLSIQNGENTIELFGQTYEVIGEYDAGSSCPIVPFLTIPDDLELNSIGFTFEQNITREMYEEIVNQAQAIIPGVLIFPDLQFPDADTIYVYNNVILISILIAVLSVINFAMLYLFVIKKRSRNLAIMRICGCTRGGAIWMYLGECLLLSIPVYLIGIGIYHILLEKIFKNVFPDMEGAYSIGIYAGIFAIYLVVMLIILGVFVRRNVGRDLMPALREGKL